MPSGLAAVIEIVILREVTVVAVGRALRGLKRSPVPREEVIIEVSFDEGVIRRHVAFRASLFESGRGRRAGFRTLLVIVARVPNAVRIHGAHLLFVGCV